MRTYGCASLYNSDSKHVDLLECSIYHKLIITDNMDKTVWLYINSVYYLAVRGYDLSIARHNSDWHIIWKTLNSAVHLVRANREHYKARGARSVIPVPLREPAVFSCPRHSGNIHLLRE